MSDARKRAEEALAKWDARPPRVYREPLPSFEAVNCAEALRALLAEEPGAPTSSRCQCADPDHCAADEAPKAPLPPEVREAAESPVCKHEWRTDGQHSNVFCRRCYADKPAPDAVREAVARLASWHEGWILPLVKVHPEGMQLTGLKTYAGLVGDLLSALDARGGA